jgi:hypothetical protein
VISVHKAGKIDKTRNLLLLLGEFCGIRFEDSANLTELFNVYLEIK